MKNYKVHFNIENDSITRNELIDFLDSYNIEVKDNNNEDDYNFDFVVECDAFNLACFADDFNAKVFCDDEESSENFNSSCEFEEI